MISGRQRSIGIGPEATFGTPVAPTVFFNGTESLTEERGRLREPLTFGSRFQQPADKGRLRISGGIEGIHGRPIGIGHLLRAALGAPETEGAGPYVHTFEPGNASFSDVAALPPYSISVKRGPTMIQRYAGGQLNQLTLTQSRDDALVIGTDWIAKGVTDVADTAMVQEAGQRFRFGNFSVERDGAAYKFLEQFGLTINNALETEELLDGSDEIAGTAFGDASVTVNLTATFESAADYADFRDNIARPWAFKWTLGDDSLELSLPRLNVQSWSSAITGPGRQTVAMTGVAEFDAVEGYNLQAVLTNTHESY